MIRTLIQAYSLERGKVGELVGEALFEEYSDVPAALVALDCGMSKPRDPRLGYRFLIVMPDERQLAFDSAYTEFFGEPPVKRDNKENLYPRLKRRN